MSFTTEGFLTRVEQLATFIKPLYSSSLVEGRVQFDSVPCDVFFARTVRNKNPPAPFKDWLAYAESIQSNRSATLCYDILIKYFKDKQLYNSIPWFTLEEEYGFYEFPCRALIRVKNPNGTSNDWMFANVDTMEYELTLAFAIDCLGQVLHAIDSSWSQPSLNIMSSNNQKIPYQKIGTLPLMRAYQAEQEERLASCILALQSLSKNCASVEAVDAHVGLIKRTCSTFLSEERGRDLSLRIVRGFKRLVIRMNNVLSNSDSSSIDPNLFKEIAYTADKVASFLASSSDEQRTADRVAIAIQVNHNDYAKSILSYRLRKVSVNHEALMLAVLPLQHPFVVKPDDGVPPEPNFLLEPWQILNGGPFDL
jgi:hypothetical protein